MDGVFIGYLLHKKEVNRAYTNINRGLPLLAPMSEIAGRLAVQAGARSLEVQYGGRGILLGGVPGVAPGKVLVLGGGMAGVNAVRVAVGMGAQVVVIDKSVDEPYIDPKTLLC
jgi:alanine dehydrogenase